jgi:hypothetical protein
MVSLATVAERFLIPFQVVEGGSGVVKGIVTDSDVSTGQVGIFVNPRHILRCSVPTAVRPGLVIRSPLGAVYMVGANGPSEHYTATLWQSFKLFQVTRLARWERHRTTIDPITRVPRNDGKEDLGLIWVAFEPLDRMLFDKRLKDSVEQTRFIAGAAVMPDDVLDGQVVTRSDIELGLHIGVMN